MLNPFPELLVFEIFAPTLLRVVAACVFFYAALVQVQNRKNFSNFPFPFVGTGEWVVWASVAYDLVVGAGLFAGFATQFAALLGMFGVLASLLLAPRYLELIGISRIAVSLLFIILGSLLLSGAGAFAFDLPL